MAVFKRNRKYIKACLASLVLFSGITCIVFAGGYKYPYSSFKERDPFKPLINESGQVLIKEKRSMGDFVLQGIMYSPSGSQVIINNEVLNEGDTVEGYKIKKIDIYRVVFEKDGEESILKWEEQ